MIQENNLEITIEVLEKIRRSFAICFYQFFIISSLGLCIAFWMLFKGIYADVYWLSLQPSSWILVATSVYVLAFPFVYSMHINYRASQANVHLSLGGGLRSFVMIPVELNEIAEHLGYRMEPLLGKFVPLSAPQKPILTNGARFALNTLALLIIGYLLYLAFSVR